MKHKHIVVIFLFSFLVFFPFSTSAALFGLTASNAQAGEQTGKHTGESSPFEYSIEYLNPLGVTIVDETGIFYDPFDFGSSHDEFTILPANYFGSYDLYFVGSTVQFRVHITNTGSRTYKNLLIRTQQELLNPLGGAGTPFPEPNDNEWFVRSLGPGKTVVLEGSVVPSGDIPSGIDQTHLQIIHLDNSSKAHERKGSGRILLDDPQAGLWCPLTI